MIAGETLINAFVDANILFCLAYFIWVFVHGTMCRVGFKYDYGTQLGLLNAVFITIICAPLTVAAFGALQNAGVAKGLNVNLSDLAVSYYLNGGLAMKASDFERLIQMRDTFILNVLNADGILAITVIIAFVTGVGLGLARLGCSIFCLWRIVASSYTWRRVGRIHIRLSDRVLVPFTTRALRDYYVVIPLHMLGQSDALKVSLAHEFQHIRQRDLEWEVVLEVLKPLFFFNPAYQAWKRQVEQLRELSCDSQVIANGRIEVRDYCDTLLSVCKMSMRRDRAFVIAVPKVTLVTADRMSGQNGKLGSLEHRILSVLNSRRRARKRRLFLAGAIPLIAAVILTSVAIQRPGDWSQDRLMLSTVVNLDRLDEINRVSPFGSAHHMTVSRLSP